MPLLRVLLGFAKASDHVIEETAGHVLAGLYGQQATFPDPPVAGNAIQAAMTAFTHAIAARKRAARRRRRPKKWRRTR